VAQRIVDTYFDARRCLLIRLPVVDGDLTLRMTVALTGISAGGSNIPQARAKNVYFLADDLADETLHEVGKRLSLLLHQSFEFWQYTPATYRRVAKIRCVLDKAWKRPSPGAKSLLTEAFGQEPSFLLSSRLAETEWMPE
jgi:hypothetical protein